ncbi:MAG TPA: HD domain-containing phosphohydrolase [Gemmatimonadaceae bacterium]
MTVAWQDASSDDAEPSATAHARPVARVSLSRVLVALSRALDLGEGRRPGHTARTCLIGMRLGETAGLDQGQLASLYHALLLKDLGGSANATRVAALFGADDQVIKARLRLLDWDDRHWDDRRRLLTELWPEIERGRSLAARLTRLTGLLRHRDLARELISLRAERGAALVQALGFPPDVIEAIRSLDERYDGRGHPAGLAGDAIPMAARIMSLAQALATHLTRYDAGVAAAMAHTRAGRWFDPRLASAAGELLGDDGFVAMIEAPDLEQQVLAIEPAGCAHEIDAHGLDEIARAFADVIDAKSPYLAGYSRRVAHHARVIGARLGFDDERLRALYRAGLLHDLGMLAVSSRIHEHPGPLNAAQRTEIEQHPLETWETLRRTPGFEDIALLAARHHEKLDGSGYPWRLVEDDLDGPTRVLGVAVVFVAAMTDRAFRRGLAPHEALLILDAQRGLRLDAEAVDALASCVEAGEAGAVEG